MFKDKILLITGGTGSFGNAVLQLFLNTNIKEIRIFSRDEKKQDDMRKKYKNEKITFFIGDIRNKFSISKSIKNVDYIFHAAALKQVPSCEFYPMEAVETNIIGTDNLLYQALEEGVKKVICLSTDKAVYPINSMGLTKSLMEKVMIANSRLAIGTDSIICATRYGNVMSSRGSVIPLFQNQIKQNLPITITDPKMTRFMMTLKQAVELVLYAFNKANNGDIFVQKSPSTTIEILAKAILEIENKTNYPINYIGTRHGEKLYEALLSREEMASVEDLGDYFRLPADFRNLNYEKYVESGKTSLTSSAHKEEYNSHNTRRLSISELKSIILSQQQFSLK